MNVSALSTRARVLILAVAVLLFGSAAVVYVLRARSETVALPAAVNSAPAPQATALEHGDLLMVRAGPSRDSGEVFAVPEGGQGQPRATGLQCKRFYAAAGTGLCLRDNPGLVTNSEAIVVDDHFRELRKIPLSGAPSRARVSPSGRMAAWTFFVAGDSYLSVGFSTRTGILDTRTGTLVKSLEDFTLEKDGRTLRAADVNYWGVTFASDDNRFYATVATGGRTYLVEGDFARRRLQVLRENAECPSLSPDGTRVVYKKRTGGQADPWHLYMLDLRTGRETPLSEPVSVDDQVAWRDDDTVMYSKLRDDTSDVWAVPADGSGRPTLLLRDAYSPAAM
ncbi:TolB-like translocation protein; signal peptide [Planotetraspora thailandica]|uniref:TolB-like translocation protein signal peptide n=1 Tax=Planotetraspora thailandica TaxID=487172 RepID=A0A8J3V1X9_9ACTN|nr:PD40 domain-containing protein [Planotetraspora thailandica]GII53536.1 TolB-like translocation protein; signal peptide [Planotetraspora thailandica]